MAAELPFLHLDPSERRIHDKSLWESLSYLTTIKGNLPVESSVVKAKQSPTPIVKQN